MTSNDERTPDASVIPRAELSFVQLTATSDVEVLEALAARARDAGWVLPSFKLALLEREKAYPTGLPTPIPVAIPHADAEHVLRPGLGVATLRTPVSFGEMGGSGERVDVRIVVLILVTDPREQVELLTRLISLFQQEDWFDTLNAASTEEDLARVFGELLDHSS